MGRRKAGREKYFHCEERNALFLVGVMRGCKETQEKKGVEGRDGEERD